MIKGTTPTFSLQIKGDSNLDLTLASSVYVTIEQRGVEIELSGSELTVEPKTVHCFLPQEESLKLSKGDAEIQVNWTYNSNSGIVRRNATVVQKLPIGKQLLERVI
jgi:hypothetical protein